LNSVLKGSVMLGMIAASFYLSFWQNMGNWSIGSFKYGLLLSFLVALVVGIVLTLFSFRRSVHGDCRPALTVKRKSGKYVCGYVADLMIGVLLPTLLLFLVIYGSSWGLQTHTPVLETNVVNITGSTQYRRFNLTDGVVLQNYTQSQSYSCGKSSTCYVTVAPIVPNASTWLRGLVGDSVRSEHSTSAQNINLWAYSSASSAPQSWLQPIRQGLEQSMTSRITSTVQQACSKYNLSSANFTVMTWENLDDAYEHAKLVSIIFLSISVGVVLLYYAALSPIRTMWCPVPPLSDDDLRTYQTIQ